MQRIAFDLVVLNSTVQDFIEFGCVPEIWVATQDPEICWSEESVVCAAHYLKSSHDQKLNDLRTDGVIIVICLHHMVVVTEEFDKPFCDSRGRVECNKQANFNGLKLRVMKCLPVWCFWIGNLARSRTPGENLVVSFWSHVAVVHCDTVPIKITVLGFDARVGLVSEAWEVACLFPPSSKVPSRI